MKSLKNKVVFITGASQGLGEEIAYQAAARGATLVLAARSTDKLEVVRAKAEKLTAGKVFAFTLDVANPDQVEQVVNNVKQTVGTVDVLINNAGFGLFKDFLDFDMDVARKMFEVNVLGLMVLTQKIAIEMAEAKRGHIINIVSMAGKMATQKSTVYSATKFAVLGYSNALRLELRPLDIRVTTVNPGPIRTHFFDKADESGTYLEKVGAFLIEPQDLAEEIVNAIGTRKREINRPRVFEAGARLYNLFPIVGDFLAGQVFNMK
jgi:short-subunit dehydrogenase